MSEPHGEFRDCDELQAVLRMIVDTKRTISRQEIDRIGGLPAGLASKCLAKIPERKIGPKTMPGFAGAIGVKFLVVDDPEAMARYTARADQRVEKYAKNARLDSAAVEFKFSLRKLRRNGRKGGKNSRKYMTRAQARKLARHANRMRWHKPKLVELKGSDAAAHRERILGGQGHGEDTSPAIAPRSAAPAVPLRRSVDTGEP